MKKIIVLMLALSMLLVIGCAKEAPSNGDIVNPNEAPPVKINKENVSDSKAYPNFKNITGKFKDLYYADNNMAIIVADKIYLYDLFKASIATSVVSELTNILYAQSIEGGYAIIGENRDAHSTGNASGNTGMMAGSMISGYKCIFYDNNLNKVSEIVVNDICQDGSSVDIWQNIAITSDGKKLAYANFNGLYLYNIAENKKIMVIDLKKEQDKIRILGINGIDFTDNDTAIAFVASCMDVPTIDGSTGYNTCGFINIADSVIVNKKVNGYSIYEMLNCHDDFALFPEDFNSPTGRVLKMNTKTGETSFLTVSKKEESKRIFGSDKGAYYATTVLKGTQWQVNIYESKTSKLVSEQVLTCDEEVYRYRDPALRILDDLKTCIILLGHSQVDYDTRVVVKQF